MKEIDPKQTDRAAAFDLWIDAPMPMITLFKTLDVKNLIKTAKRRGCKFNMLLCWCIGKAASQTKEFSLLPVGKKLMQFDKLAVSVVVEAEGGGISTCDIPFCDDLLQFDADYRRLTGEVRASCRAHDLGSSHMVIGTSALAKYDIDGAVNIYAGIFNNPFLIWGKYKKHFRKALLSVSFQFHHTQMDGAHAAAFLSRVQAEIDRIKIRSKHIGKK